jgi:glycosyltransferase involved in cell wall biosynthesis
MPSRTEGLPRALVEAMARGLPAVGTDVGGIPELLDSRCIVRPDDDRALAGALAELLRHADLWEEQSRRNLDVASGFRVEALRLRFESRLENAPAAAGKRRSRSA